MQTLYSFPLQAKAVKTEPTSILANKCAQHGKTQNSQSIFGICCTLYQKQFSTDKSCPKTRISLYNSVNI